MVHAKPSSTPMALGQKLALEDNASFPDAPTQHHWSACKRLLRYVSGTHTLGLYFRPTARFTLEGFSDADWACNVDDRRSTTGYCVFLGGNLVTWSSCKQQVVARSRTESEYWALASVTMELIWIKSLLDEL
ncbi:Retrovirus-related Pol polyprotein from transposon RE2 [Vitis vinifera]|uniref:Retrovirus-related Pol polyprotein from transposon RE2 n=1 Tax=Vitis vinifera TaxID=29760 RepID=A0A438GA14_VITVI|nr:Retrovirus-related Pol polyprotein from transposon RE2 [Vitis vinifera]